MCSGKLRIVHCIRAPLGGAFRHLSDLVESQSIMGHDVGCIYASNTLSTPTRHALANLKKHLSLGLFGIPMARSLSPVDVLSFARLLKVLAPLKVDVLHGHGAKGGVWARTIGTALRATGQHPQRIYSPHGGSLHYKTSSLAGKIYIRLEKTLRPMTDACVFTSTFEKDAYISKVGLPQDSPRWAVVHNGLHAAEFTTCAVIPEAKDFLFVGELRKLKGIDVLIEALADLHRKSDSRPTLAIVGEGPDKKALEATVKRHKLQEYVSFHGYKPLAKALPLGTIAVIPSRAEALPYIVLEMIAAKKPLLTTNVGGIPEIFANQKHRLLEPGNVLALQTAMAHALTHQAKLEQDSLALQAHLKSEFSLKKMAEAITQLYQPAPITTSLAPHPTLTSSKLPPSAANSPKI